MIVRQICRQRLQQQSLVIHSSHRRIGILALFLHGFDVQTILASCVRNLEMRNKRTYCPREPKDDARLLEKYRNAYITPRPTWVDDVAQRLTQEILLGGTYGKS
jgi:hypothetical protein